MPLRLPGIVLSVLAMGLLQAAGAAAWYVLPGGDDGGAGDAGSPLASLEEALTRARAGDRVHLLPGRHVTGRRLDLLAGSTCWVRVPSDRGRRC